MGAAGGEPDAPLGAGATSVGAGADAIGAAAGTGAAGELGATAAVGAEGREAPKLEPDPLGATEGDPPPAAGRGITPPVPEKASIGAAGAEKLGAGSEGVTTVPLKSCRALAAGR